ncbi:T9SS type A sorting domain-containing protein [Flavobacterium sp. LaA7.5]|nr:T9SS type A sorting domain-containing protein [Flavobacterium salilacus subsp. altitudinum]
MQKLNKLIVLFAIIGLKLSPLQAQTTILEQSLLTQQSFDTFTPISVTGEQNWNFYDPYGAVCSGFFGGENYANEDWLISPAMNLSQMDNVKLTFSHTRGNAAVMNVGVNQGWYKAFATANFTGDPLTTEWIELEGLNQNVNSAWQFISSGELIIPEAAKSQNSRIAFRYICSSDESATWEIKNVKVTGQAPGTDSFKITNWNTEWLGCEQFGPNNEDLQIENVVSVMLSMNADIYCIQEVSNTSSNPSIQTLVSLLGSDQWGGAIVPSNTGACNQRQGIIYKKSKVQLVDSFELMSGSPSQGNSYHYNWTSGRYPAVYHVNLIAGSELIPLYLVNIHAKAEDGEAESYTRRLGGSQGLKNILDGMNYNTKNIIVIGDFNDYLIGTSSDACNCTNSPFKNFIDDENNYNGITKNIIDVNTNWGTRPLIEHFIISDELFDNYIANSAAQDVTIPQTINNFYNTTSNHLPVSARFEFTTVASQEKFDTAKASWTIYPNPVKDNLNITITGTIESTTAEIYDLTGRLVLQENIGNNTVNVSNLPAGIYILRMDNRNGKFVKE